MNLDIQESAGKGAPLNRVDTPQDIANMVLFLASDESSYTTAQEMIVDGKFIHESVIRHARD